MTVASQFAQALASAESVCASLKSFALETQDQQAKQMFQQLAQNMDNTVSQMKSRLNYIMQEEPQYANEIQPTLGGAVSSSQNAATQHSQTKSIIKKQQ